MPTVVSSESAPQSQRTAPTMRSDVRREAAPDRSKLTGADPPSAVSGATPCSIDGTSVPAMSSPGFVTKSPLGSPPAVSRTIVSSRSWSTDPGLAQVVPDELLHLRPLQRLGRHVHIERARERSVRPILDRLRTRRHAGAVTLVDRHRGQDVLVRLVVGEPEVAKGVDIAGHPLDQDIVVLARGEVLTNVVL